MRSTPERDLSPHLTPSGHLAVDVEIGRHPHAEVPPRTTGASAPPAMIARFLRELADDVERLADNG